MDKKTVELLAKIISDGKAKIAKLIGDMSGKSWSFRVHVFYGEGFGEEKVKYDFKGRVTAPNRVIKINGIDGLHRWLVNFKSTGFNYAKFQDVVVRGKDNSVDVHESSKVVAEACDDLLNDYYDIIMKRVPSVVQDTNSIKEVKSENADLRKSLADLQQRMDAQESVQNAAKTANEELDTKTTGSEEGKGNTGSEEDEVKTLLESGTKAQLIAYILKNVDQAETESQLKKKLADDLKAVIVSAQE